jgi:hypothetical protein
MATPKVSEAQNGFVVMSTFGRVPLGDEFVFREEGKETPDLARIWKKTADYRAMPQGGKLSQHFSVDTVVWRKDLEPFRAPRRSPRINRFAYRKHF